MKVVRLCEEVTDINCLII